MFFVLFKLADDKEPLGTYYPAESRIRHCCTMITILVQGTRAGGDIGLFITIVRKVLYSLFFICWLINFGDFYLILIGRFIRLGVQTFQPPIVIYRKGIFLIIIGDVHPFISYCLIPLDPCQHNRVKWNGQDGGIKLSRASF